MGSKSHKKSSTEIEGDSKEYIAEALKANYGRNGLFNSFKVVWIGSIIILLLVGLWMIYNRESSSWYVGGRLARAGGKPGSIDGYGVLSLVAFMAVIGIVMVWAGKRKKRYEGK